MAMPSLCHASHTPPSDCGRNSHPSASRCVFAPAAERASARVARMPPAKAAATVHAEVLRKSLREVDITINFPNSGIGAPGCVRACYTRFSFLLQQKRSFRLLHPHAILYTHRDN